MRHGGAQLTNGGSGNLALDCFLQAFLPLTGAWPLARALRFGGWPVTCVLGSESALAPIEGPLAPIVYDLGFLPRGEPQGGALQTFLQRRKNREQFARAAASALPAYGTRNRPAFLPEVRLRGITHKAESNSKLSWPRNGRVGPVDIPTSRSHCKGCVKRELGNYE